MPRESVTEMVARNFRDYKGEICHEKKRDIETAGQRILLFKVMYRYHYESPFTQPSRSLVLGQVVHSAVVLGSLPAP